MSWTMIFGGCFVAVGERVMSRGMWKQEVGGRGGVGGGGRGGGEGGRNRRGKKGKRGERETKRNERHEERAVCEAKTCNYACPGVCQNEREEVPVVCHPCERKSILRASPIT